MTTKAIFVIDTQANWIDEDGSSRGISTERDLIHLIASRNRSDVIVTSGKTARDNRYKVPKRPLVVITRQPAQSFERLQDPKVSFVAGDVTKIIESLEKQYDNLLIEFGPELLQKCIAVGQVDEIEVSVTGVCTDDAAMRLLTKLPFDFKDFECQLIENDADFKLFSMIRPR